VSALAFCRGLDGADGVGPVGVGVAAGEHLFRGGVFQCRGEQVGLQVLLPGFSGSPSWLAQVMISGMSKEMSPANHLIISYKTFPSLK